jgi:hypothetical protein
LALALSAARPAAQTIAELKILRIFTKLSPQGRSTPTTHNQQYTFAGCSQGAAVARSNNLLQCLKMRPPKEAAP